MTNFPYARLKEILEDWRKRNPDADIYTSFYEEVGKEFAWTVGQAYIATDFLFRPENHN